MVDRAAAETITLTSLMSYLRRKLIEENMMTSSNGNIFRVTVLCEGNSPVTGEFPFTKASDAEL